MKDAQTTISKLVEVGLRRFSMIEEGDRILIGLSGGKDSTALAWDLARKRRWWPVRYELAAAHVATDLGGPPLSPVLEARLASWDLPLVRLDAPVRARLKPGRLMNCYWCSTQRRTELIRYALERGFTKIALGHHLDDIVETLLMNMLQKGELSGMLPVMRYKKYPLAIIRPLALVEERQVIDWAVELGLDSVTCTCGFGLASKRREVRSRIIQLTQGSSLEKRNLFESMFRVNIDYLGGIVEKGLDQE